MTKIRIESKERVQYGKVIDSIACGLCGSVTLNPSLDVEDKTDNIIYEAVCTSCFNKIQNWNQSISD